MQVAFTTLRTGAFHGGLKYGWAGMFVTRQIERAHHRVTRPNSLPRSAGESNRWATSQCCLKVHGTVMGHRHGALTAKSG